MADSRDMVGSMECHGDVVCSQSFDSSLVWACMIVIVIVIVVVIAITSGKM